MTYSLLKRQIHIRRIRLILNGLWQTDNLLPPGLIGEQLLKEGNMIALHFSCLSESLPSGNRPLRLNCVLLVSVITWQRFPILPFSVLFLWVKEALAGINHSSKFQSIGRIMRRTDFRE